jgi:hypothetical protein
LLLTWMSLLAHDFPYDFHMLENLMLSLWACWQYFRNLSSYVVNFVSRNFPFGKHCILKWLQTVFLFVFHFTAMWECNTSLFFHTVHMSECDVWMQHKCWILWILNLKNISCYYLRIGYLQVILTIIVHMLQWCFFIKYSKEDNWHCK